MHGPEEVSFTNLLFEKVEDALGIKKILLKLVSWMKKEEQQLI